MRDSVPQSRQSRNEPVVRWISNAALALLPVLACFLGGATQKWAEGIVVAVLGLYLVARPPHLSLGKPINCVVLAFIGLAAVAFLPARWFFSPAWRSALVNDFSISLPQTLSAQPWITAGALISLLAGISWLYIIATQELELRSVRFQLRLFVGGVVSLAAIAIVLYLANAALPFWINQRGFGPFPNRNQTADLLGITSIVLLACAQDDLRRRRKRWLFWLAGLSVLITAIILNYSRAGLAILVGGSALWISAVALRQRSPAKIALGLSVLLLLLSAVLLLGGQTLERFNLHGMIGTTISSDFRWKIFHDTFQLIRESPWCGIGLGNFESVFAIFRKESVGSARALHPESDWLWLWAELGWLGVILAVIGGILLIWRVLPLQEGTNQRFRLAALIGAIVFALHGLVDVSGHRLGTALSGLFLLGLSLHRPLPLKTSRSIKVVFRFVGLLLVIAGVSWTVAARGKMLLPGSVGVSNAKQLSANADRGRNFAETIRLTTDALNWAPLDWQLYFARAFAEVGANQEANALADFRRARFLEPNIYAVPLIEGNVWLSSRPVLAATAWREALRRAGPQRAEVYASMLTDAAMQNPQLGPILKEFGLGQPDLALAYLRRLSGVHLADALTQLLKNDPNLRALSEPQKLALFDLWAERGNLDQLARYIQEHSDWMRYAWLGMAKYHANKKDFRAAYELTQRFGEAVALPRTSGNESLEQLQQRYVANPDNYSIGYALYREQIQRGRTDDALVTARHFSERPNSPAYFRFLESECWGKKGNWERAWNAWQAYRIAAAK